MNRAEWNVEMKKLMTKKCLLKYTGTEEERRKLQEEIERVNEVKPNLNDLKQVRKVR